MNQVKSFFHTGKKIILVLLARNLGKILAGYLPVGIFQFYPDEFSAQSDRLVTFGAYPGEGTENGLVMI